MSPYWLIAIGLAMFGCIGAGYHAGYDAMEVECQRQVEKQQEHVIRQIQNQNQITQGVENAYHTGITAIDALYATAGVQPAANGAVRGVSSPACGTQTSKKYRLTFKQCDAEEFKCNALWNWAQQQSTVK